jgi:hypothetical protein
MVLKTFNVEDRTYKQFSDFCKGQGLSMSKQVEFFMRSVIEEEPTAKEEYIKKLDRIRKQKSMRIGNLTNFKNRYNVE